MLRSGLVAGLLLVASCDEGATRAEAEAQDGAVAVDAQAPLPDAAPACTVAALYSPSGGQADVFPDDFWTVADASTATGMRVALQGAPWVDAMPANYQDAFHALERLDGFGTAAPIFVRFSGPVKAPEPGDIQLRLEDSEEVPFEVELLDDGVTLAVDPLRPLQPGRKHRITVTAGLRAADGGCVDPAPGFGPAELVSVTFTTQSALDSSAAVAQNIRQRRFAWAGPASCQQERGRRRCDRSFVASDYRGPDGTVGNPRPQRSYTLPVSLWIPDGEGPWPVVIAGHGLSDSRLFGSAIGFLAGEDFAGVAIDSPFHGEHPGGVSANPLFLLRDLFAIDLTARSIDPARLRDNLRTATFDKLQLLALLKQDPDADGDGRDDFDVDHIAYFGLSLGGILGSEFLALADGIGAAVLSVPGAEITRIMRDSDSFGPLVANFVPRDLSEADIGRIFAAIQTGIEAGDPVNFARRILQDRLPATGDIPHLMVLMAVGDETVPNSATAALARALGLPILAPAALPWTGVEVVEADPLVGNRGSHTAGLYQHVKVTGERPNEPASHNNVTGSPQALGQIRNFFATWIAGGPVEISLP